MTLGVILAAGESMEALAKSGQDERFIKYYLSAYEKVFNRVLVFSYANEKDNLTAKSSIEPNRFNLDRFLYLVLMPWLSKLGQCDVMRVTQATSILPAVLAKWLWGTRMVVTYGYDYELFAATEGQWFRCRVAAWYLRLLRFADVVIITTPALKDKAQAFCDPSKIVLLPNGADVAKFIVAKCKIGPPWILLYVGRLTKSKNVDVIIEAVSLTKNRENICLVCIGEGECKDELLKKAQLNKVNVEFTGAIQHNQLFKYYQKAHLFLLMSQAEGQSKVLIEALSAGLPVVVSKEAAIGLGIQGNEIGVVTAIDANKIAIAIDDLISNPAKRSSLAKSGREFVIEKYDLISLLKREIRLLAGEKVV